MISVTYTHPVFWIFFNICVTVFRMFSYYLGAIIKLQHKKEVLLAKKNLNLLSPYIINAHKKGVNCAIETLRLTETTHITNLKHKFK